MRDGATREAPAGCSRRPCSSDSVCLFSTLLVPRFRGMEGSSCQNLPRTRRVPTPLLHGIEVLGSGSQAKEGP
jgi:hypothetical protein